MFSLQRIFGRDDEFCALFEASAQEACQSVAMLQQILLNRDIVPTLEAFADARRKEKKLSNEIADLLIHTFITAMEREDIEALAMALYRVPKTVEKFAERYIISADRVRDIDFSRQVNLMDRAATAVFQMIKAWRGGARLKEIKALNATIQKIESDADDLVLELTAQLYAAGASPLKAIIAKDLFELNEKVVDRCRDAGNVITHVVLKNT
ncbi:MAG: pit accessory protein [Verrucomicrobia bacterium]|nr:pit accessory protein [Verrucomicrobiota bacterium]